MPFAARSATKVRRIFDAFGAFKFQDVIYLLSLFVSLAPKVCDLPTCPLSFCNWIQSFQGFDEDHQLLGLSQFF
jgi:hypothetical protein